MIFTAYFDESGTHTTSPFTVMAGIMANVRKWERFEAEFRAVKKKYGFNVFHTKKFKRRSGEFKGWSHEQCANLMERMDSFATPSAFSHCVVMTLENEAYEKEYRAGAKPRRLRLDSKYGLCFRECLHHLLLEVHIRRYRKKIPELHVVLESGHKNAGDAERIFDEVQKALKGSEFDYLRTITFAEKDKCDPLMIADFIAHTTLQRRLGEEWPPTKVDYGRPKGNQIVRLWYRPRGLTDLKGDLIREASTRTRKPSRSEEQSS